MGFRRRAEALGFGLVNALNAFVDIGRGWCHGLGNAAHIGICQNALTGGEQLMGRLGVLG